MQIEKEAEVDPRVPALKENQAIMINFSTLLLPIVPFYFFPLIFQKKN